MSRSDFGQSIVMGYYKRELKLRREQERFKLWEALSHLNSEALIMPQKSIVINQSISVRYDMEYTPRRNAIPDHCREKVNWRSEGF